MRVLIDRHQADLFYALQVIFEDRLGLQVYTPVGLDWWDSGYWRFGEKHFGRDLANQYLGIDAKYALCGCGSPNYYVTRDPAHPDRIIRCVTLEQFRALGRFSHVVASVQDNQAGFARLAAEIGGKYVYQIGNTRQEADWSLDPLALVSSEVPITGRGVRMHQPMAPVFDFHDPGEAEPVISSFVNLMPRLTDWPLWVGYQGYLPEFTTRVYGIDGPDGNLHPVDAIAAAMGRSAFGLHLKPTGDGFGHVLHNWAAVGRPLIGRANYYRGQLGEHLWRDGVTCIDLDQRSPQENADLIRAVWADKGRYRAMCEAIRAEYETIDWDREAKEIQALLL